MKKQILSIVLVFSIVASLFAGLGFSANATTYTDYTVAGVNSNNLNSTGKDAAKSLIVGRTPDSAYVFNTITVDGKIAPTNGPLAFEAKHDEAAVLTSATDFTTDGRLFPTTMLAYTYDMFANWTQRSGTGTITEILDNEENQWVQINYNLDGEAAINTVVFGAMATTYSVQMPGHYKIILSDTEDGLLDHTKAKAVIELDAKNNETLKTSRHTVTLNTPVTAKYFGIRFICMFNESSVGSVRTYSQMYTNRIKHLSIYGEYTTPATIPEGNTATASSTDTEGTIIEGITSTATAGYVGNADESGDYAIAGVKLATAGSGMVGNKYYEFKGWYLGDEKVTEDATADYYIKGSETDLNFVAKYLQTYKPFTDYTAVGDNSKSVANAATSLLADKAPTAGYYYNGIEGHYNLAKTTEPTLFELKSTAADLTKSNPSSADCGLFADLSLSWYMFKSYDSENKVSAIINDETKQWAQLNYTLDGKATISEIRFGNFRGSYYWQSSSHYKLIISDTAEGLMDFNLANAVIDVDMDKDTSLKAGMQVVTLTSAITAKYVAIRFISTANSAIIGQPMSNMYTDRMNYFGVQGTYTNPIDAEVTVNTESGVPSTLVSKADPVYGTADASGNYSVGTVKITATENYQDKDNKIEYIFKGWYKGETLVSNNTEYTYDLSGGDATFTAKYDVEELVNKCILVFEDATHTQVGTLVVKEGQLVDMALVNQITVRDMYGYKVLRDGDDNVVWNQALDSVIVGDMTITACYEVKDIKTDVTIYNIDGTVLLADAFGYDTVINLSSPDANSWVDADGNVLIAGSSGKIYACGDKMDIYAKSTVAAALEVVIVGKVHSEGEGFSVFAHINAENVTERGIIFASSKAGTNIDFTLEHAKADTKRYSVLEINTLAGNSDFMATLTYGTGSNPTRYARAYVKVGDNYYYSNIVGNK